MSIFRKFAAGVATVALGAMMAGTAVAAGGSWDGEQMHYNVYSTYDEVVSSQFFMPPPRVDRFDMATSVYATVTAYDQSNTEMVRLCYTEPYGTKIVACTLYEKINGRAYIEGIGRFQVVGANEEEINGGLYNNVSAKGSFTIQHMFPKGPSRPLISDGGVDSLVVSY
ncbi:branched-chain amino acid ABC transporter substrate-binding protein [Mobiluncus mulieris]|uniref:Branched-chain amino acid ABC transporter substrate-binding protein n=1 Tax=Mobiluncus mulieris TaxID=2052 RepID=A0A7Y0USZ7_9ACTO|nr:branched-chain amino acid ABC transporter substrate-binding protein [Mobiluncus mulieris]NMX03170.1 branched-chain amino acid ABC transporter substrate-binding protein [Mobiluncus mulieris]